MTRMSRKTGIPVSTIFDKVRNYKKSFVERFTCLFKFGELGFKSHSFTVFSVNRDRRNELKKFLLASPSVNALYRINHKFDFLVDMIFKDIQELEDFFDIIDDEFAVRPKHIFYVVNDIGRELFLSREVKKQKKKH